MSPYDVLGLDTDADADAIRCAYLEAVRRHPPDRAPAAFQRIQAAYDILRDPDRRAELHVFGSPELWSLGDLARALGEERRYVGPDPWREVLEG